MPGVSLNGRDLVNGIDYDVSYGENKDVGEGTVTITGRGNYTDEINTTFNIKMTPPTDAEWKEGDNNMSVEPEVFDPVYTSYEDIPVMMTVEEFGRLMRVSRNTAYAFVREGLVPTVKIGRQIRIYRGDVLLLRSGLPAPMNLDDKAKECSESFNNLAD